MIEEWIPEQNKQITIKYTQNVSTFNEFKTRQN